MRLTTITVAATLMALWATAPANADEFRPADSHPQLAWLLPTARAAWPDSACRGHEEIAFTETFPSTSGDAMGAADVINGRCLMWLRPRMLTAGYEYLLCVLVAHEIGHLAGVPHSYDPLDLMYPAIARVQYAPCAEAVAGRPPPPPAPPPPPLIAPPLLTIDTAKVAAVAALDDWTRGQTPTLDCKFVGHGLIACRAQWQTRRFRYRARVVLTATDATVDVFQHAKKPRRERRRA